MSTNLLSQVSTNQKANDVLNSVRADLKLSQVTHNSKNVSHGDGNCKNGENDDFVSLLSVPTVGSRNLLKQISSSALVTRPALVDNRSTVSKVSCQQFLASHFQKGRPQTKNDAAKVRNLIYLIQGYAVLYIILDESSGNPEKKT